ncbi:LysM peptidoglycan-binding domain-containing protein [Pedosphaera parvula]|uniref:Peptidoglycan-binding LysM n=1 Tax=Pedosphaera parvula (strain Ellin514) TaxID=320771 RepID=B9XS56_PEDPL|nr:LysM domain-containing protein [Pedosphaera parvula]EEF57311.1 Peptidoglycan-binding LysM [Pedosphaera parvula Ellin514]
MICLIAAGCLPPGDNQLDEQKEPHFLTGKSQVNSMDFQSAIDSFEKALQVNPRSASAHFELAWLYEGDKIDDPAAAIYHYEQFLKLRPNSDKTDVVKMHINSCKQKIASSVSVIGQMSPERQRELEKLLAENKDLKEQVAALKDRVSKWEAYYVSRQAATNQAVSNVTPGSQSTGATAAVRSTAEPVANAARTTTSTRPTPTNAVRPVAPAATRSHAVKAGETPAMIARQYGVSLNALQAANPQLQPTRMKVGQVISIPSQ